MQNIYTRLFWQRFASLSGKHLFALKKKRVISPAESVCMMCSFLSYLAGLQNKDLIPQVEQGVEILKTNALHSH